MMRNWVWIMLLVPCAALAQDAERRAEIKELMRMTGSAKLGMQFAQAVSQDMGRQLKQARPDIPDRALEILNQELLKLFGERIDAPGGLLDRVVPVYEKHFSQAEIRDLLAFYRTPTGQKAINVMPMVLNESIAIGQAWGRSLAPEINRRIQAALKREGIEIPKK